MNGNIRNNALFFGWRVAHASGNLNNGTHASLLNSNFNNDSGNDNPNIGAQLSIFYFLRMGIVTSPLGEKHKILYGC